MSRKTARTFAFLTSRKVSIPRAAQLAVCALAAWLVISCERAKSSPDWQSVAKDVVAPHAAAKEVAVAFSTNEAAVEPISPFSEAPLAGGFRFMTYNVENWLTMDRYVDRKNLKGAPKPDSEKSAVISIITRHSPDIIGLSEIGTVADLAEIQQKLKAAGLDLPHSHHTGGSDAVRHLGILSRFPIIATSKPATMDYKLDGKAFSISRGILDATIVVQEKSQRFIGVHLKSKRETDHGDQSAMRLNEARLLRRHIDSIFASDANARIIVYGDLNDTRATPAIKAITGRYNSPTYLTAIPAKDSAQNAWTHHWALHDIYSRIDYVMVSPAMKPDVVFSAAKLIDDPDWSQASDHRAILAVFR